MAVKTRGPQQGLSRREREIADLVAHGLTNREIAERLYISERTVDRHLENVRDKLGVSNRVQVAAWVNRQAAPPMVAISHPAAERRALTALAALLVIAIASVAYQQFVVPTGPTIETFAGGGTPAGSLFGGFAGDYLPAPVAKLNHPSGLAVDGGTVYIADQLNNAIRSVSDGVITTVAGRGAEPIREGINATSAQVIGPQDVVALPDGSLYFTTYVGEILRLDADRTLHRVPAPSETGLWGPYGLALDPMDGAIYVSNQPGNDVWRMSRDGGFSRYAGAGPAGFAGDGQAALGALLDEPVGLACDARGNLFIADRGNNRIRRLDRTTGVITTVAGSAALYGFDGDGGPATRAKLGLPTGVAVDSRGDLFIADADNNRVRLVNRLGLISTIAGRAAKGFGGDGGPATEASLLGPTGVALDSHGNLLIADTGYNRVRLVRLAGQPLS